MHRQLGRIVACPHSPIPDDPFGIGAVTALHPMLAQNFRANDRPSVEKHPKPFVCYSAAPSTTTSGMFPIVPDRQ